MRIHVTPQARNDLQKIRAYISDEFGNPSAAVNVVKNITVKIRKLADFPAMGAALSS